MRRRDILKASMLAGAVLPVPRVFADAAVRGSGRKFIFVVNPGGWDPTRVLAPEFDNANVDMERDAGATTLGGITFADHPDRPSVAEFMRSWHERTLILKGMLVPSVAHDNCLRLCMTGSTRQDASDWPAIIRGAAAWNLGAAPVRVAGSGSSSFSDQCSFAVDALALGVSRCVTVSFTGSGWDTHVYNDLYQSQSWEGLYSGLGTLMESLAAQPGESGGTLADETIVVVLSEMGRTPRLNAGQGKDHWPYTSMMLVGHGFTGDRVVGAYDTLYYGRTVDLASGELSETGATLSSDVMGATLLRLAGVDSEAFLPGVARLDGVVEE